ncbi:MAG: ferritin [Anaerolineae bacterium]|nr:ferritin [Anaerolineae bacterium]
MGSHRLMGLLNQAIARELQVSIQYMFQHSIGSGQTAAASGRTPSARRAKFVASHSPIFWPGATLRKVAIAEMRHAEAIVERVVHMGGEPTTQPGPITIGETAEEMLQNDREQEQEAIALYRQIIGVAQEEQDETTLMLFQRILSEEESHHRIFSELLAEE